ncbi:MAG: DEAD/DEAH box helicase [Deltaproteobacteria bacterium]|nr:DEAD/DEAH box helicase [Deltaproteobacteria bacterium]
MTDPSTPSAAPSAAEPKPTFDVLPLNAEVRKAIDEMGYSHPTPVQLACYDPVVRGKDVLVQARTGTGKTSAFGLPLVDQVVRKSGGLQVLTLCPTRELALQVAAEVTKLGKHRGIKVAAVYGGAPMGRQIAELEDGAHIVVGTPGRVLDHLRRGTMDPKGVRALVLDEADEMLSMGFEKELSQILERLPAQRQTLLFSATVTIDVNKLVRKMNEPETIMLSGDQVGALDLAHYFYLQRGDKARDLLRVIEVEDPQSAICFCNTKDETERVAKELQKAGYAADYISGDLDQRERERVMNATREGKLRFLVATDVAARGIDISHLTHVINVDFPETAEAYVHRTGRTGRAGRTGTAISLISPKDIGNLYYLRLTYGLKPIERTLPTEQELSTRREADLISRVEQLAAGRAPSLDARSLARRVLAHDDAETLVATLLREVLGSALVSADEAARARRAKNPPPVEAPKTPAPRSAPTPATPSAPTGPVAAAAPAATAGEIAPDTRPQAETRREPRPRRDERPRREPRDVGPVSAEHAALRDRDRDREAGRDRDFRGAHSELTAWSPPDEPDDESPILAGERRRREAEMRPREPEPRPREERPREPREERPREPREERPREPREPREARRERPEDDNRVVTLTEVATIFVNSGRRDRLRPSDLIEVLEKRGAIEPDAIGRVRVRDRNTFLDVRPDVVDRAIAALKGVVVHGRTLNAELARPKDSVEGESADDERPTNPLERR